MPKKISKNQKAGYIGEADFVAWATKMGWLPTKLAQDHGIDFTCQIIGNEIDSITSAMSGQILNVSVRSTEENSDYIIINRSDAELFLNSKTPIVLAMVKRAPLGIQSEVAICFMDTILNIMEQLLDCDNQTVSISFSHTLTDIDDIRQKVQTLFETEYKNSIDIQRIALKSLSDIPGESIEIIQDSKGQTVLIKKNKQEFNKNEQTQIKQTVLSVGLNEVYFQDEWESILHLDEHVNDLNHKVNKEEFLKAYLKSPVPLILAVRAIKNEFKPPKDILARLRKEHKNNITAHLLAAGIQSQCFNEPVKAYQALKKVAKLAEEEQEIETYLNCLLDLWQQLDKKLAKDCYDLAMSLAKPESLSAIKFQAGKELRNSKPDKVFELLKDQPDDPIVLQMKGNAHLLKKEQIEAAKYFQKTAELTNDSVMYNKAGYFFLQENEKSLAIECYEKGIALFPDNIIVRSNLADIYTRISINLEKAITHLSALNDLQPNNSKVLINLATCYARLFEPEKSLKYYNQACEIDNPMLAAVAGKSELLISMKREDDAFIHLEAFKEQFKNDSNFLLKYMKAAHYAGFDDKAHLEMKSILASQEKGEIKEKIIQEIPPEKGMEMFKENAQQTNERNKNIHEKMLQGQFPWLWAESTNGTKNFYWGWIRRTQEFNWLFEYPVNWANYTIYSTNRFHAQKDFDQRISLLPIKSSTANSTIVVDISALITLHQLDLLDSVTAYFDKIIIPEEYLETVLTQGKEIILHQKSTYINAMRIKNFIDSGDISILTGDRKEDDIIKVDEYYSKKPTEKTHHIKDIIESLFVLGTIDENIYKKALKVCSKPQTLTENNILQYKQKIQMEYSTLRTFADLNLLGQICDFFNIYISSGSNDKNNQIIRGVQSQNDCINKYYDLWRRLKADPKVEFIRAVKTVEEKENDDPIIESALFATNIARAHNYPLLVDDRVLQALKLNESQDIPFSVFGTDALILRLMESEKLSKKESLDALLKLMKWRYRFIVIPAELLKEAALIYSNYPPGKILKQIAEYVQECMRDPGLFTGIEKTQIGESMAIRLYLTWSANIADFIALMWEDNSIPETLAEQLTEWCINEFLPSAPTNLLGAQKVSVELLTQQQFISKLLLKFWSIPLDNRIANAMKSVKKAFMLTNEKYLKLITKILNEADQIEINLNLTNEENQNARKAMMSKMLRVAFEGHITNIEIRSFTALKNLKLIKKGEEVKFGNDINPNIFKNRNYLKSLNFLPGPLLVYFSEEKREHIILETKNLFCSPLLNIRKGTLEYYENMISEEKLEITHKTISILKHERVNLLSSSEDKWQSAAVAIYDAIDDDIFISIAGINQIFNTTLEIKENLNSFVPKVLHPSMSSMDSIVLDVQDPELEHDKMQTIIKDIVKNENSLVSACKSYYNKLGYLPLAANFSLAEVVKKWLRKHPVSNVWNDIWEWADNEFGPIPQYHACTVFVLLPDLIPAKKLSVLWTKIKTIIYDSAITNKDAPLYEAWKLRGELNRHLMFHIEANHPDANSAVIASVAWRFTERVAFLFGSDAKSISFYREQWVKNAYNISTQIWLTANPKETESSLRMVTHTGQNPWAISLLILMGKHLETLKPEKLNKKQKKQFHDSFIIHLYSALPFNMKQPDKITYAFQGSWRNTITKWKKCQEKAFKESYVGLLQFNKKYKKTDGFIKEFETLADKSHIEQMTFSSVFKNKTFGNPELGGEIAKILNNQEWRDKTLLSIHPNVLGGIVEALTLLQAKSKAEWVYNLPHFLADLCKKTEDEEIRENIFFYVIHTSLACDSVSAIRKLLTGKNAGKYIKYVKAYQEQVKGMQREYPPWVAGKLRALMVAMNIY